MTIQPSLYDLFIFLGGVILSCNPTFGFDVIGK